MKNSTSNVKEITKFVKNLLIEQYPKGFVFEEFSGGSMRTRTDLALFESKHITFVEIKSDKDVLTNLENQIRDYKIHCDSVLVILDVAHWEKWKKMYSKKYSQANFLFYDKGTLYKQSYGEELHEDFIIDQIEINRYYSYNSIYPSSNINILNLLWKPEKQEFTYYLKGKSKILNDSLVIKQLYTYREIVDISYEILYDRMKERNKNNVVMGYPPGQYLGEIPHKEHRQELFNNITCPYAKKGNRK